MVKKASSTKASGKGSKAVKKNPYPVLSTEEMFKKRSMELTDRERAVLKLFAHGHSYIEIGEKLDISSKTVGSYLQRVREKARTKTRSDLITLAMKEGLLSDKK